jgi:hypothetical protein
VLADLRGRVDLVIDAGQCEVGVESTIVSCSRTEPTLLRPGGIARDAIERVLGSRWRRYCHRRCAGGTRHADLTLRAEGRAAP